MKILYLRSLYWFNLNAGGSVGHTAGVINAMSKKSELKVVSNEILPEVEYEIDLVKPVKIKFLPKDINELIYNIKLIKYCKNIKCDAIYQRYNGFSFCGAYLAKKKNVDFILEFNSSDVWKMKHWKSNNIIKNAIKIIYNYIFKIHIVTFLEKYNIKNATKIVVVSQALKELLIKFNVPQEKIIVNPNGIDENRYNPDVYCDDIKTKYDLMDKIIIGFIGTFGQWHGAENIALAYKKLLEIYPELAYKTKLLMVGDGVMMDKVKANLTGLDSKNVILTGLVPQRQGARYLNACDILVNVTVPNPDGSEFFGSPTKLFEYMGVGKAIICSDMAQMSEILEHKKSAFMVKPADVNELVKAMKILIDDENLRLSLGKNARDEALKNYTWVSHVDKILRAIG